jgi:hypothetical protein
LAEDRVIVRARPWVARAVKAISSATIFGFTLYSVYTAGPWLETRFFPVVGKLEIESAEPGPMPGTTLVRAAFRKLRNCDYIGIAWFRGTREDGFERVPIILQREPGDLSSPNRPVGYQQAGPWIIGVAPDELRSLSFAELQHRCHSFWVTTTEFWP